MGFNIIVDNYYSVGDVIKIGDFEGKVIELGVKTTKLQDVNNENVLIIANRNIGQALKSSDELIIDVPAPYEEKTEKIEKIIDVIVDKIKEETREVEEALLSGNKDDIECEIGDLLFSVVNLARFLKIKPNVALYRCNNKIKERFQRLFDLAQQEGISLDKEHNKEMNDLWDRIKEEEK